MVNEPPAVSKTARYSIAEAAKKLEIHRATLYRIIKAINAKCTTSRRTNRKRIGGDEIQKIWLLYS